MAEGLYSPLEIKVQISDDNLENSGGDFICWMLCANISSSFAGRMDAQEPLWCLLTPSRAAASAIFPLG